MRKILSFFTAALVAVAANAVPAVPHPINVTQPDGTNLTIKIVGDEFFNYHTTVDGYTLVRDESGYFVYALSENDNLVASKVIAHNQGERTASESQFVGSLKKGLFSKVDARAGKQKRAAVDAATKAAGAKAAQYDYNNFRGLIVLVDYNDLQFTRSDAQDFYYHMANEANYTGFVNEDGTPNPYGECTGSVRDYYYDNSQGRFSPTFDVVGPVHLNNYSVDDHNKWDNTGEIWAAALNQVNSQVDFTQYDGDNDGNIDMIFFIGAGSGSNSDGSSTHLWPHKSDLYWEYVILDGKRARTYACSTEYLYDMYYGILDGIGTICHEFSHVLGLPDLYDTDYESGGGQSQHPGDWDIMSGGSYQNYSRTPVAYSLYDRYSIGFANAQIINNLGEYSLNQIGSSGEGYILNTPENNVKFYLENRQNTKWDTYAPGHGMLICRVDSTNISVWDSNDVNCNPSHNYYVLLRAGNGTGYEQADDAFPAGASFITNTTTPNLRTWNGLACEYVITNIREQDGVIYFNVGNDSSLQSVVEDFEEMPVVADPPSDDVQGVYTKWKFVNSYVTNPGSDYCNGEHAAVMKKPSALTMTEDVRYVSYMVTFNAYNSSTTQAKFILYCSTDKGNTWNAVANQNGETTTTVGANSNSTLQYTFNMDVPARYRISMSAGASTYKAYVDDFTIHYTDVIPDTEPKPGDVNGDGNVTAADITVLYNFLLNGDVSDLVNGDQNHDGIITSNDVTSVYNILLGNQ
jgi:M6 family metalloprotease-like protein